jgi:serine/threonine protein kinase
MKIISHPQIVKYKETIHSKSHIYIIAEYIYGKDLY